MGEREGGGEKQRKRVRERGGGGGGGREGGREDGSFPLTSRAVEGPADQRSDQ